MQDLAIEDPLAGRILDAALAHVPFDGWSQSTLRNACRDAGLTLADGQRLYPGGGVDLALAYHRRGDRQMSEVLAGMDLTALRFRERVAQAVRTRLDQADRELVRRGTTLFALPQNSLTGAGAIWGTADAIWNALGDRDSDLNWYTKRMSLSAVYGATVLFWLGDDSPDGSATADFLDRRIDNVMQFEKLKASLRDNPAAKAFTEGPAKVLERLRAAKPDWTGRKAAAANPFWGNPPGGRPN